MGLLNGQIASAIFAGFKGKLLKGTLRRETIVGGLDEYGDGVAKTVTDYSMEGFTENYTEFFRKQAGIPDTDLKVNVFAKSLPAGIKPIKDDKAKFGTSWYQLRKVDTDPATALWTCQAFAIPEPTDVS